MADATDPLWQGSRGELIDRVHELEGLLAGVTRQLEDEQRRRAEELPTTLTLETRVPAELVALEDAIEAIAGRITNDVQSVNVDDLATLALAVANLAGAHDRMTPKPLSPIR